MTHESINKSPERLAANWVKNQSTTITLAASQAFHRTPFVHDHESITEPLRELEKLKPWIRYLNNPTTNETKIIVTSKRLKCPYDLIQ
jgi:hypothetical protein